jgi:hypothetical protein
LWTAALFGLRWFSGGRWDEPLGDEPLTPARRIVLGVVALAFVLLLMPWVMREAA